MICLKKLLFTSLIILSAQASASSATAMVKSQVMQSVDYISNNKENKVVFNKALDKVIITNKVINKRVIGNKEEIILKGHSQTEIIF